MCHSLWFKFSLVIDDISPWYDLLSLTVRLVWKQQWLTFTSQNDGITMSKTNMETVWKARFWTASYCWETGWSVYRLSQPCRYHLHHHLSPNREVVGAPQIISQPVFSIFPSSPLPSGTCRTPGLSIPWCCLPISFSCLLCFGSEKKFSWQNCPRIPPTWRAK